MSLYLTYRPSKIDEIDLAHVRKALQAIADSGKVSHAYLFDGPRGSGKTSAARILAKIANCEKHTRRVGQPCGTCASCRSLASQSAVDLVEIDAASNRGIDDIRELKQRIRLAPSALRRKVYIIDEVHMLTSEAFNALLKTLEEPPDHALFVLCTTEPHKLPETIISRCTRISFRKATQDEMLRALARVVKGEKAKVDADALDFLASHVDGSFRDGVKILDQVLSDTSGRITKEMVEEAMYGVSGHDASSFVEALVSRDARAALRVIREAVQAGLNMRYFLTSSMYLLRDAMLSLYGVSENPLSVPVSISHGVVLVRMIDETLRSLTTSSTPDVMIEMLVVAWCDGEPEADDNTPLPSNGDTKRNVQNSDVVRTRKALPGRKERALRVSEMELQERWKAVLSAVREHYSLEALLSGARLKGVDGGILVVEVAYAFHKQQLESERFRGKVDEIVSHAFGRPVGVRFELGDFATGFKSLSTVVPNDSIADASQEEEELIAMAEEIFTH